MKKEEKKENKNNINNNPQKINISQIELNNSIDNRNEEDITNNIVMEKISCLKNSEIYQKYYFDIEELEKIKIDHNKIE